MIINGIDLSKLEAETSGDPAVVPGRVVQIDGDFAAYMVAYDKDRSIDDMKKVLDMILERLRVKAGAESMVIHLTPKESTKGNRYDQALLREYQATRSGKVKPRFLHLIRAYMADHYGAIQHVNCEADDGMSMAQYKAIADGNRQLSIIATKDKDLAMVPGLSLDWATGEITDTKDDYGYIELRGAPHGTNKAKKIKGRGWKLFWAQMLTGDAADNISGLPLVTDLKYLPRGKDKPCGPVLAYEILSPLSTNKEAFIAVRDLYKSYAEKHGFTNWRTGQPITAGDAFLSEAKLLWMRRNNNDDDVVEWMKEHCV
jgi:DNA polymerase-1